MLTRRTLLKGLGATPLAIPILNRFLARENHPAACKVLAQRWTGSGLFCGFDFDENGTLGGIVSTNAHVAPQLGGRYNCQFMLPNGIARSYTGTAKFVVYSRTKPYDFSFLHVPAITPDSFPVKPVAMSKDKLVLGQAVFTTGSPRGVWPLVTVENKFSRWLAEGINGFTPNNAIGGQSGSGIQRELAVDEPKPKPYSPEWSFDPNSVDECKLAWTWNNLMAGMDSNLIWRLVSADDRRAEMQASPDRPPGLIEVATNFFQDRGLQEGIFEVEPQVGAAGIEGGSPANVWNASKLKIWYRPADDGPIDPPPTGKLTPEELKACEDYKAAVSGPALLELLKFGRSLYPDKTDESGEDDLSLNAPATGSGPEVGLPVQSFVPASEYPKIEYSYSVDGRWKTRKPPGGLVVGKVYPGWYDGVPASRRLTQQCDGDTGVCTYPWVDP